MPDSSNETVLEKQLMMTSVTWKTLQSHGVTDATPLLLDLFWFGSTEEGARAFASSLVGQATTSPTVGLAQDRWAVEAQYGPQSFSLDSLRNLVKQMCELGFAHQCEFDGWGAQVPASAAKDKPWWKLW